MFLEEVGEFIASFLVSKQRIPFGGLKLDSIAVFQIDAVSLASRKETNPLRGTETCTPQGQPS
jgi:hypothetical protein